MIPIRFSSAVLLLSAAVFTASFPFASPAAEPEVKSPYPVIDSGAWADPIFDPAINWIDDNRVLFKAVEGNDKQKIGDGPFNLSIFDVTINKVTSYSDFVRSVGVCYSDGFIYYVLEDQKKNVKRFAGEFGKEKPFAFPARKVMNPLDCQLIDDEILAKRKTRSIIPLKKQHGYLDMGPASAYARTLGKDLVKFYRPSVSKGIELPIPAKHTYAIKYYQFKDAYLIYGHSSQGQFWWLYSNGKVEEGNVPEIHFYPVRNGIVVERGIAKSNRDSGTLGLYLRNGDDYIKLIGGKAANTTVSPDGCKLAFVHYPYSDATLIKDPARITLKAINLCVEEK